MDEQLFRQCLSHFATGVTVITTINEEGGKVGVTINTLNSVSLKPPLVLFCLENIAHSLPAFLANPYFTVNMLSSRQSDISKHFADRLVRDKWRDIQYKISPLTQNPILPDILCFIECKRELVYTAGDHQIIIGEVIHGEVFDKKPLIYYGREYL